MDKRNPPRHVALTGASSGIGEQLALAYAGTGVQLSLAARRLAPLEDVAQACREKGAETDVRSLDVTDDRAVCRWVESIEAIQPIDLLIVNAGLFDGNGADRLETSNEIRRLIEVNLLGAVSCVQAGVSVMRRRGSGHIAVMSSLAAILPAPDAPSYSASKAALVAYCDALRILLAPDGITVSVVLPGHVRTPQTDIHVGPLAMLISAEDAARRIKRGLDAGRSFIAFPRRAHVLVRLAMLLPWRLRARVTASDRFHVHKPS